MYAKSYLVPVLRRFPIWRFMPIHWDAEDRADAFGWCPDWYECRSFPTRAEAEAFRCAHA